MTVVRTSTHINITAPASGLEFTLLKGIFGMQKMLGLARCKIMLNRQPTRLGMAFLSARSFPVCSK
jgi:hypothetical protein